MNIDKFLEVVDYRINGGSQYLWECFGQDAWVYDIWDTFTGYSVDVTFDTKSKIIYKIESAYDKCYVWYNPDFFEAYKEEAKKRNFDVTIAWDNVKNTEVSFDEIIEKCEKILYEIYEENGIGFDSI